MSDAELIATLVFLAGAVNRLVELIKPVLADYLPEQQRKDVTRLLSILLGIIAVGSAGGELNILRLSETYGRVSPIAGVIVTGVLVGGFSNGIHAIAELLTRKPQRRE